jgi:hypothetical protein
MESGFSRSHKKLCDKIMQELRYEYNKRNSTVSRELTTEANEYLIEYIRRIFNIIVSPDQNSLSVFV